MAAGATALAGAAGLYARSPLSREKPRHVVLLSCDTLRADRLGVHGYSRQLDGVKRSLTPNIDRLTERGILFLNNYAQANWTETSMASMWRSAWPINATSTHSFDFLGNCPSLLASNLTQTVINQRRYDRIQIQTNRLLLKDLYTEQFSDVLNETGIRNPDENAECNPNLMYPRAEVVRNRIEAILRSRDTRKNLFLNAHFMDVHEPYSPVAKFGRHFPAAGYNPHAYGVCLAADIRVRDQGGSFTREEVDALHAVSDMYDASLMLLDKEIGKIVELLDGYDVTEDALVIFMGDHGQSLEERAVGHGTSLWNSEIKTPLIVFGTGVPRGLRVGANTRNVDIMPTIADFVGITNKRRMDGASLYPLINDAARGNISPGREAFSISDCPRDMLTTQLARKGFSIVDPDGWKYITFSIFATAAVKEQLFNLKHDPLEQTNLASIEPDRLRGFRDRLAAIMASRDQAPSKSSAADFATPEKRAQFRGLGYLGR